LPSRPTRCAIGSTWRCCWRSRRRPPPRPARRAPACCRWSRRDHAW
jgi:hypothetical protein